MKHAHFVELLTGYYKNFKIPTSSTWRIGMVNIMPDFK